MIPIGKGCLRGIKGVIAGLVEVAPIRLGKASLNVTTLSACCDRACSGRKADLQIEVCACTSGAERYKRTAQVGTASGYCRPVAEEVLTGCAFAGIPIADLQLAERHCTPTGIDDVQVRLDLIISCVRICSAVLHT